MFKELIKYKELLKTSIKKEIRGKYKGSTLGVLWSFINPLLMIAVYGIVFSVLFDADRGLEYPYYLYLSTGILPWIFFTTCISQGSTVFVANANLIKKVYFPREILPISVVLSGVVNFVISSLVIIVLLFVTKAGFSINILYFPLIILVQVIFTLGIVLIISSVNVYVRDVEYIVSFLLLLLMYLTPILWVLKDVVANQGEKFETLAYLNPLTGIIESYHNIFFFKTSPNFTVLGLVTLYSVIQLFVGVKVFRKLERGFAEEM